jgi:glycosyltransferase involved in cell wall biosynthesis
VIDLLMMTLNEVENIPSVAALARESINVFIVDSGSTDGTVEAAEAAGLRVVHHRFDSHSRQRNWALDNVGSAAWVFFVDADERITFDVERLSELADEADESGDLAVAFRRRNHVMGHWLKHGGWWPDWQVKLMRRDACRYDAHPAHTHVVVPRGRLRFAKLDLHHDTYSSIDDCWAKILEYSSREAAGWRGQGIVSHRPKHRWIKSAYARLPGKPILAFLWRYVIKLGFLDGRMGLHLAIWSATYEDIITAKRRYETQPVESDIAAS